MTILEPRFDPLSRESRQVTSREAGLDATLDRCGAAFANYPLIPSCLRSRTSPCVRTLPGRHFPP